MKGFGGAVLVLVILGATFYGALSFTPVFGSTSNTETYDEFWRILNREAYLIYEFNESLKALSPNKTIGTELISNSRMGELNAANISAQVWIALQELKKSGVKLHYTAEELREMARNISEHGLPNETIRELKSQGWTDEEIKALEEYIARNANSITSGFDMESFLVNFSKAFVLVGFKYASYEAWTFEKMNWFDSGPASDELLSPYKNAPRQIVPDLKDRWLDFYSSYESGNVNGMLLDLLAMVSEVEKIISSSQKLDNGGVIVAKYTERTPVLGTLGTSGGSSLASQASYYWPGALSSYRTMREIYVLLEAMKLGNNNLELKAMLNQKVAKLKDELVAYVPSESVSPVPSPNPPNPSPLPIPCSGGKCLLSSSSPAAETSESSSTKNPALDVDSNYGYIDGVQITLIKSLRSDGHVEYRIRVEFSVESNRISNVNITLTTPDGSDSVHYSTLSTGQHTWESKTFISSGTITSPGDSIVIDGNVKITYISTDSPTPNSAPISVKTQPLSAPREQELDRSFYFRVTYNDLVQASNVHVRLTIQPSSVSVGDQVTFRLTVENDNNASIKGYWRASIEISDENNVRHTKPYSGDLTVGAKSSATVTIATVSYPYKGDYKYSVTFHFGDSANSETINGTLHVSASSGGSTDYRLWIESVSVKPEYPKEGDTVNFTVKVNSGYPDSKHVRVKLFVDGRLVDLKELNVGTSGASVTLHWLAEAGEHSYTIKAYRLVDGQELWEDSWSGSVNVAKDPDGLYAWLEVMPNSVKVDGTVNVKVRVENHNSNECFYQGTIRVVDDGRILWPSNDYSVAGPMTYPCDIFAFDYTINDRTLTIGHDRTMVQNFTLEHVSKNMTLHLIIGDVERASARINVVQSGPVISSMNCTPAVVSLNNPTTCTVHLKLKEPRTITLHLRS